MLLDVLLVSLMHVARSRSHRARSHSETVVLVGALLLSSCLSVITRALVFLRRVLVAAVLLLSFFNEL